MILMLHILYQKHHLDLPKCLVENLMFFTSNISYILNAAANIFKGCGIFDLIFLSNMCLPAGEPVRVSLCPRHQGRAGSHRPSGALCCRLRARKQHREGSKAGIQRSQGCHRWCRPGRSDLRRRPRSPGLRGNCI